MRSKKSLSIVAIAAVSVLAIGRATLADTITVHSLPNNVGSISTVIGGTYNGDKDYRYDIEFDQAADVLPGNGFMVIDFGPLDGYSLTGPAGAGATLATEFTESTQNTGAGLSGFTGNSANVDHFSDAVSGNTSDPVDFTLVKNAVFIYNGATAFTSGPVDLTLDLFTTDTSTPKLGNGFGVDSSGASLSSTPGLSFELAQVFVPSAPTSVPLPMTWINGTILLGLVGVGSALKRRTAKA